MRAKTKQASRAADDQEGALLVSVNHGVSAVQKHHAGQQSSGEPG